MGYTHNWTKQGDYYEEKPFKAFLEDVKLIVKSVEIPLGDRFGDEGTSPEFLEFGFSLNGIGDDSHETFSINIDDSDFEFCKTAQKPYDDVVTTILLTAKFHLGDAIKVSSDGGWVVDWIKGCQIFNHLFPDYEMVIPDFVYS